MNPPVSSPNATCAHRSCRSVNARNYSHRLFAKLALKIDVSAIGQTIEQVAATGSEQVYIEILAVAGKREPKSKDSKAVRQ